MQTKYITELPIELRKIIYLGVCRNMRKEKYKNTIPYESLKTELLEDAFHKRIKICSNNTHMVGLTMALRSTLQRPVSISYLDYVYLISTTTRFYYENSTNYILVYGDLDENKTDKLICSNCDECSMQLSHKKKQHICKLCKCKY